MKRWIHLGPYLVLLAALPALADGGPVEIRKVEVFPAGGEVRLEITLSSAVTPAVETAQHPARLILKLPGTVADAQQKRIAVRQFGVRSIRYGLNQAVPPETRFVVDLDQEHTYKLSTDGMKIVLVVEEPLSASARRRTGPAAAATRPLLVSLGRRSDSGGGQPASSSNQDSVLLSPPPSGPPIQFPAPSDNSESTARATATAPAAENVPPVTEATSPSGFDIQDNQSSANANVPPGSAQQPLPQEPKLSTDASPEAAASAREDANTSLPSSSGQSAAANQTQTAVVGGEQEAAEGTGQGRGLQPAAGTSDNPDFRTAFRVKYVAQDAAYLDGGRAAGLAEGMKLVVRDLPSSGGVAAAGADSSAAGDVAELEVLSVAETSAVTEIHIPRRPVKVGDLAYLSSADQQALVAKNALSATRKYPAAVSFTENDTLDDEARTEVPKPPLPSVNRARGRIGFDYMGVVDHGGSGMNGSNLGMVVAADITRINGTYWNVSGYWRGRFDHTSAGPQTLQDLINRTYHLYTSYDNPRSSWVAGFGRMYLPWATSLDTIDGGYIGRKVKTGVTAGVFLGSTPDPTSYSYNPQSEIGGAFVNFEGGSYDDLHYTSTTGGGINMLKWSPNRPFLFTENSIFYKRVFSIYQATQIDSPQGYWYLDPTTNQNVWKAGDGLGCGPQLHDGALSAPSARRVQLEPHLLSRSADLRSDPDRDRTARQVLIPGLQCGHSGRSPQADLAERRPWLEQPQRRQEKLAEPDVRHHLRPCALDRSPRRLPLLALQQFLRQRFL